MAKRHRSKRGIGLKPVAIILSKAFIVAQCLCVGMVFAQTKVGLTSVSVVDQSLVFGGLKDKDDYVEIPNAPSLEDIQEGNFSISLTYTPAEIPQGKGHDNGRRHGLVMKRGHHVGLVYKEDGRFAMSYWVYVEGVRRYRGVTSAKTYVPGQTYHVTASIDWDHGAVRLYVDGVLAGMTTNIPPQVQVCEYGVRPWTIGMAAPGSAAWRWPAYGAIDDVAFYGKALDEGDVRLVLTQGAMALSEHVAAYYCFDTVEGGAIPDASGHGHAGVLHGEPQIQGDDTPRYRMPSVFMTADNAPYRNSFVDHAVTQTSDLLVHDADGEQKKSQNVARPDPDHSGIVDRMEDFITAVLSFAPASTISAVVDRQLIVSADGDGDFQLIEEALAQARPGDRILLRAGRYQILGTLRIPEGIHLLGEDKDSTIIDAGQVYGEGLFIESAHVIIESVTLENAEGPGIYINQAKQVAVKDVIIQGHAQEGIRSYRSQDVVMSGNIIRSNAGRAIFDVYSENGEILHNVIEGNDAGIGIMGSAQLSSWQIMHNIIRGNGGAAIRANVADIGFNLISDNTAGLFIPSFRGHIVHNTIVENTSMGIHVTSSYPQDVSIHHNISVGNGGHGIFVLADKSFSCENNISHGNGRDWVVWLSAEELAAQGNQSVDPLFDPVQQGQYIPAALDAFLAGYFPQTLPASNNQAPLVPLIEKSTNEDESLLLNVFSSVNDPEGDMVLLAWFDGVSQEGAVLVRDGDQLRYQPRQHFNGSDTFTYTVMDDKGAFSTGQVVIGVVSQIDAPVANAGVSQGALEGETVILDGRRSYHPDGEVFDHVWRQIDNGAPSVVLIGDNTERPSFVVPSVFERTQFEFELEARTPDGSLSSVDRVRVRVALPGQFDILVDDDPGADFADLHEAVRSALPGQTVRVNAGRYQVDHLSIPQGVCLVGENPETTILESAVSGQGSAIVITQPDVRVTGFTIENARYGIDIRFGGDAVVIADNIIQHNRYGVFASFMYGIEIDKNLVQNNVYGLYLKGAQNSFITDNTILRNGGAGISMNANQGLIALGNFVKENGGHGILSHNGQNIFILTNIIVDTRSRGLYFHGRVNFVAENVVVGGYEGIRGYWLDEDSVVMGNIVVDQRRVGMQLDDDINALFGYTVFANVAFGSPRNFDITGTQFDDENFEIDPQLDENYFPQNPEVLDLIELLTLIF